ncbi:hypothetical protein Poli38472_013490 [Pythium oligandrum]|uniref:Ankyrin n=1 Tax=Pythium oligandrum TaxID=41045 RepID=A0A8K1C7V8_PYTOL|nr:hypothetical protein Poli38472_013490 [Pythium oligandrum]|eukprot:TMW58016.1 hypothetical protein Poli38472_013490 [Pythium oligandrum]
MGCVESKVAALPSSSPQSREPFAVVAGSNAASGTSTVVSSFSSAASSAFCCTKKNRTAPAEAVPTTAASAPSAVQRSPTIDDLSLAKGTKTQPTPTAKTATGPPTVLLPPVNKAVTLENVSYDELCTHLLKSVKNGDLKAVVRIVEVARAKHANATPSIVDVRGMWESTPLIYACQYVHEPIALWLLDANANANAHLVNERGVTALLLASLEGMTAVVERILAQHKLKASEDIIPLDQQIGVVYNAVADLNVRVNPLLAASMNGHHEIARLLLKHGAAVNLCVSSSTGPNNASGSTISSGGTASARQYPLLLAAKYGHSSVTQLLIKRGADFATRDANESHALLLACESNQEDCALGLLNLLPKTHSAPYVAAWKRANCHGFTALHYAAVHGLVAVASLMLQDDGLQWGQDKAFLNATSATRRESALLMACRKRQLEVARVLLQCGADAHVADRGGTSALDVLKREKRDELLQLWCEMQLRHTRKLTVTAVDGGVIASSAEETTGTPQGTSSMKEEQQTEERVVENTEDNQSTEVDHEEKVETSAMTEPTTTSDKTAAVVSREREEATVNNEEKEEGEEPSTITAQDHVSTIAIEPAENAATNDQTVESSLDSRPIKPIEKEEQSTEKIVEEATLSAETVEEDAGDASIPPVLSEPESVSMAQDDGAAESHVEALREPPHEHSDSAETTNEANDDQSDVMGSRINGAHDSVPVSADASGDNAVEEQPPTFDSLKPTPLLSPVVVDSPARVPTEVLAEPAHEAERVGHSEIPAIEEGDAEAASPKKEKRKKKKKVTKRKTKERAAPRETQEGEVEEEEQRPPPVTAVDELDGDF